MKRVYLIAVSALLVLTAALSARQAPSGASQLNADVFSSLKIRNIGPALVTGRVQDVEIDPKNPNVWYVASAFGGLWKTQNRGVTFEAIFPRLGRGRGLQPLLRRRRSEGFERRVARHRRERQPAQRALRHRALQVHRRGQDLESRRPRRTPNTSARSPSTRAIRTSCTWRRRGRCSGPRAAASAASTRRRTAARPGRDRSSSTTRPASRTSCSIRRTRTSCLRARISACGTSAR